MGADFNGVQRMSHPEL
jgi:hypothetical protein